MTRTDYNKLKKKVEKYVYYIILKDNRINSEFFYSLQKHKFLKDIKIIKTKKAFISKFLNLKVDNLKKIEVFLGYTNHINNYFLFYDFFKNFVKKKYIKKGEITSKEIVIEPFTTNLRPNRNNMYMKELYGIMLNKGYIQFKKKIVLANTDDIINSNTETTLKCLKRREFTSFLDVVCIYKKIKDSRKLVFSSIEKNIYERVKNNCNIRRIVPLFFTKKNMIKNSINCNNILNKEYYKYVQK